MLCVGLDVSKKRLDCAVKRPDGRWYTRAAPNTLAGVRDLAERLCQKLDVAPGELRIVMEATGPYHEQALYTFHELGFEVCIANPKQAREFASSAGYVTKNDTVDAKALALYGPQEILSPWTPPPEEVRALTALLRRLEAVEKDRGRETNRLEKTQATPAPAQAVLESIERSIRAHDAEIRRLEKQINDHIDRHPRLRKDQALLQSIPGVGEIAAKYLLRLLHHSEFRSARQAAAYIGLAVRHYESGTSVRRPSHITKKGNAKMRATLYMPAVVAKQHNPALKAFYNRLIQRGKLPMVALIAVMRKLVHIAFGVIKNQKPFDNSLASSYA